MIKNYQGEHFAIQKTQDVPSEMSRMHSELSKCLENEDAVQCVVKDIKGCYPNMPKGAIRMAMRDIAEELGKEYSGVLVPKTKRTPAALRVENQGRSAPRAKM